MSKIIAMIPAMKTFDLPVGQFKATLSQTRSITKQTKRGPQQWLRLVFEVEIESMSDQIPCAGRNFPLDLNPGSDLRNFLEIWLGNEFFKAKSNQELDFDTLIGKHGNIVLSHYLGDDFEKPLVKIDNVFPSSSLKMAETKPVTVAPKIQP